MRWQRGLDRPLQLGKILFAGDFFYFFSETPVEKRQVKT